MIWDVQICIPPQDKGVNGWTKLSELGISIVVKWNCEELWDGMRRSRLRFWDGTLGVCIQLELCKLVKTEFLGLKRASWLLLEARWQLGFIAESFEFKRCLRLGDRLNGFKTTLDLKLNIFEVKCLSVLVFGYETWKQTRTCAKQSSLCQHVLKLYCK